MSPQSAAALEELLLVYRTASGRSHPERIAVFEGRLYVQVGDPPGWPVRRAPAGVDVYDLVSEEWVERDVPLARTPLAGLPARLENPALLRAIGEPPAMAFGVPALRSPAPSWAAGSAGRSQPV